MCFIELLYTSVGNENVAGSVEIDMAPFVGKGEVYQAFKLQGGQSVTRNAQVNAFFTIYESDENNDNKLAGTRNSVTIN